MSDKQRPNQEQDAEDASSASLADDASPSPSEPAQRLGARREAVLRNSTQRLRRMRQRSGEG